MSLLRMYIYREPECPVPQHVRLIHLDADPWELGKNIPLEIGLQEDPKAGLAELVQCVSERASAEQSQMAAQRRELCAQQRVSERDQLLGLIEAERDRRPMTALTFMGAQDVSWRRLLTTPTISSFVRMGRSRLKFFLLCKRSAKKALLKSSNVGEPISCSTIRRRWMPSIENTRLAGKSFKRS